MSLTTIIDAWANLSPATRGILSVVIAIIFYAGFRYLIYRFNKIAKQTTEVKKGNYWERLRQRSMVQFED